MEIMGGGGSMQHARITMMNNRDLLKKARKRGFFKRDLSYAEIRKYYKESTDPIARGKGTNSIALREIREKLIREKKRNLIIQLVLAGLVIAVISFGFYHLLGDKSYDHNKKITIEIPHYIPNKTFEQSIYRGEENLKLGQYFMAVGNYQKALGVNPGNIQAEFGLAKTYAIACFKSESYCNEATEFIKKMEIKYPNQKSFTDLQDEYLADE